MAVRKTRYRQTDEARLQSPTSSVVGIRGKMALVSLDSLIRISPDAIFATDKEGKITLINQGAERLMGYKAKEIIGKPVAEFYPKEEVVRELTKEMHKGKGEVVNCETAVKTRSGEVVPVLISTCQLRNEKGEIADMVAFIKDLSEKKKAEEELRSSNMELAVLNEISMILSQSFDLEEALNKSLDKILEMISLDVGLAYLIDKPNELLVLSAHQGVSEEFLRQDEKLPLTLSTTLAGKIAQSGEPIIIDDYPESSLPRRKLLVKEGIKSAAFIPFRSKEKTVGTLIVGSKDYRKFIEQEIKFLSSVAHQMGIAIQNAKFNRELERERDFIKMLNHELSALNEISWAMSQSLSLKEVMDIALTKVIEIMGMNVGVIRLLHEKEGNLVIAAHRGLPKELFEKIEKLPLNERNLAGAVASSIEPILVEDAPKDPRSHEAFIKAGLKSGAAVPLLAKGKIVGTLLIGSYSFHSFHPGNKGFLAAIGNQIGIAIENAKLYSESERSIEESLALYRMSQALNSTRTSQEVYKIAMGLVKSLFNATAIAIFLYDEKQDLLNLTLSHYTGDKPPTLHSVIVV